MTCNITALPPSLLPEPLPPYQPRMRDPETASIISAAPSYISEAPTYDSRRQSIAIQPSQPVRQTSSSLLPPRTTNDIQPSGLPAARYAEGFQSRAHGSRADLGAHNYNISTWSNTYTSHNSRQYANVAARRASKAVTTDSLLESILAYPPPMPTPPAPSAFPADINDTAHDAPVNPLEDPYLVGESAAQKARQARIYREMCLRGEEAVKHEGKSWDFLLAQMADWEERERSWTRFRSEVGNGRRKMLARRIGKF